MRFPWLSRQLWCVRRRIPIAPIGLDALDSGAGGGAHRPEGGVLSFEAKESTKESQRHGDSRGGPRRYAPWASVCGSRTVGRPEFIRGVQFRAVRPEQSDHVPVGRLPSGAVLDLGSLRSPAGKKASIAHFGGGARHVARSIVGQITPTIVRARSSPFSAAKMGGPFFPPLPIAALLRRSSAWGRLTPCGVGCFLVAWVFLQRNRPA